MGRASLNGLALPKGTQGSYLAVLCVLVGDQEHSVVYWPSWRV